MNDTEKNPLVHILKCIHDELRRITEFEADRLAQETATREMRRARRANCGNCLHIEPATYEWMERAGRTLPNVRDWTGWCTAQARPPTRKSGDSTERQFGDPPCGRYEARHWPDRSFVTSCQPLPIDHQEE